MYRQPLHFSPRFSGYTIYIGVMVSVLVGLIAAVRGGIVSIAVMISLMIKSQKKFTGRVKENRT